MAGIADKIFTLIEPTVAEQNVTLWDVSFVKEGASYYLRVFIDSENGIGIDDCTAVSHAIDPILDEADPIEQSYYLEVCSPGLERRLTRAWHFEAMYGRAVKVKLYKALDGAKELSGKLISYDGGVLLNTGDREIYLEKSDISSVRLDDMNL